MTEMLEFDPLDEAQKITGLSYKDDAFTLELGMAILMQHGAEKREALAKRDDTHNGVSYTDLLRIYDELGFKIIHQHFFTGTHREVQEKFIVLWRDGVLAVAESYNGDTVNTTSLYYNWHAKDSESAFRLRQTGRFVVHALDHGDYIDIGSRDVREGLRLSLRAMEDNGTFLNPWVEQPFLWFVDYSQTRGEYDHKEISAQVISTFPPEIQTAIAGK